MDYKEILDELGCEIIRASTEEKIGLYIDELNIIFLSENLDDIELENYTLHETAHALSRDILTRLSAPQMGMVQESRANRAMIHHQAEKWLDSYDIWPDYVDITTFLKYFHFPNSFYNIAEDEFRKLLEA